MAISLKDGLWLPELWFHYAYQIAGELPVILPSDDIDNFGQCDQLRNDTGKPIIVRKIGTGYGPPEEAYGGNADDAVDRRWGFRTALDILRVSGDVIPLCSDTLFNVAHNSVSTLKGNAGNAKSYVFRLAVPARVEPGGVFEVSLRQGASGTGWLPVDLGTMTKRFAIHGVGVKTDRAYTWGITDADGDTVTCTLSNDSLEAVDVHTVTTNGDLSNYTMFVHIRLDGRGWSRRPVPLPLFADPYAYGRLDLSRLPEGGLVLMPGDGLRYSIHNSRRASGGGSEAGAPPGVTLAVEGYVQVSP